MRGLKTKGKSKPDKKQSLLEGDIFLNLKYVPKVCNRKFK